MKNKLLSWLRPPDAPPPDLEAQLEAARAALAAARETTRRAQQSFDETGSVEALRALTSAKDAERAAVEHVDRAERLLHAAREREAAEERRRLEKRRDELLSELERPAVTAATRPLIDREVDLFTQIVELRVERHALRERVRQKEAELRGIVGRLGEPRPVPDESWVPISNISLKRELENRLTELGEPRREILRQLIEGIKS